MRGLKIIATGSYVPPLEIENSKFTSVVETSDEWISTRTGIKTRRFVQGDTTVSMAVKAAENALKKSGVSKENINIIIVATFTNEYLIPSAACMLQKELGLSEEVLAFDLNAACSGFIYGLASAFSFLNNETGKYALVVGSETISKIIDFSDRNTCVLFGDGAGAAIVGAEEGYPYSFTAGACGGIDKIVCPGVQNTATPFSDITPVSVPQHVFMDGKEVFKFALESICKSVDTLLSENSLSVSDIDFFVCHQANFRILQSAAKKLGADFDRFFVNIDKYGNTSSASIPIALDEMNDKGLLKKGMKIICTGFGGGLTYGAVYFQV